MDQASASPAASCVGNPAAPRTSSSWPRSAGRSRTAAPPPARSDPQCEPHAEPSNNRPRSSSPALCRLKAKRLSAAGFLLRRDRKPGRFSEGLLLRRLQGALNGVNADHNTTKNCERSIVVWGVPKGGRNGIAPDPPRLSGLGLLQT